MGIISTIGGTIAAIRGVCAAASWVGRKHRPLVVAYDGHATYKGNMVFRVLVHNVGDSPVRIDYACLKETGAREGEGRLFAQPCGEILEPGAVRAFCTVSGAYEKVVALAKDLHPCVVALDREFCGPVLDAAKLRAAAEESRRPKSVKEQLDALADFCP